MLGFTLPLLCLGAVEGLVAITLLLPLPFSRPAIMICKLTNTGIGRTTVVCIACFLLLLLIAPVYDLVVLHKYRVCPAKL